MLRWPLLFLALLPLAATAPVPDSVRVTGFLHGALVFAEADAEPSLAWTWEEAPEGRRSVPLALALSAAVPGAGQAYNRSWVRAAVYAGLEVALWTGYASWRGQGIDGRDAYQAEAHARWSPHRYGSWLGAYEG